MIPDRFNIQVGPDDKRSPVPVQVKVTLDESVLLLGGLTLVTWLLVAKMKKKKGA